VQTLTEEQVRVLVVQTAFLGDIILTTPLLSALKAAIPNSRLALLTTPVGKAALAGLPGLDEIICYDKAGSEKGVSAFLRKAREIRGRKFDVALSAHRSVRTALLLSLSRIPVLVGFRQASLSRIYHFRIEREQGLHEVERNLKLLEPVAEPPADFEPRVRLPAPADFELGKFGIEPETRPIVGLAPGSAWATKRWPAERYAELAGLLQKEMAAAIVLLGDEKDQAVCGEVEQRAEGKVINLCGKTSLSDLFGVISRLDLLVSNDSAPVHMASAFSVPSVVIFGPTAPEFGFGPWKNTHRIVSKVLACRPCHHHGPRQCPEKHFACMNELGAEEVLAAAGALLGERASGGG
jgi:heptosyltransferase-2